MWYGKDGILMGLLNDYNLSSLASAQGRQGNERTGTVPFMALDLLTSEGQGGEIKHLYRHDLESFIWVLVWVCLRYKDGTLLTFNHPFDDWATKDAVTVGEKKYYFLDNFLAFKPKDINPLMWSLVAYCLQVLKQESDRRLALEFKSSNLDQVAESGDDISESGEGTSESSDETAAEETTAANIELDDDVFLHTFRKTKPWNELTKLIKRSNKKIKMSNKKITTSL